MLARLAQLSRTRLRGRPAIAGAVLAGLFVISLGVFLLDPAVRTGRVLFFPLAGSRRVVTEQRAVTRHWDAERAARELVDAVLLGPHRFDAERLFPAGTATRTLLLRRHVLYVDLTESASMRVEGSPMSLAEAVAVLERTIRFNLRSVRDIEVYVDGQQPRLAEPAGAAP